MNKKSEKYMGSANNRLILVPQENAIVFSYDPVRRLFLTSDDRFIEF